MNRDLDRLWFSNVRFGSIMLSSSEADNIMHWLGMSNEDSGQKRQGISYRSSMGSERVIIRESYLRALRIAMDNSGRLVPEQCNAFTVLSS